MFTTYVMCFIITLGMYVQRGCCGCLVCVCLSVCLSTIILVLQATAWLMSVIDSFSVKSIGKIK